MIEMGVVVGLGLLVMFAKLSWAWRMRLLSNPLAVDLAIFVLLSAVHWGTFSGLMVAAVGALFCSVVLSLGRYVYGHVENGEYHSGLFDVSSKL